MHVVPAVQNHFLSESQSCFVKIIIINQIIYISICQGPFRRQWLKLYLRLIQMSFNMKGFAWCNQVIDILIPLFFDFCCLHVLT